MATNSLLPRANTSAERSYLIQVRSPGPEFHPGNYEDNEHIVVFTERTGFVSEEAIRVDLVDPGEYAKSDHRDKPELPSGRRLTSYLLQLDAYPEGKNPNRRRSVRGQITFADQIAGVITMSRLLKESETIVGLSGASYPIPRTIEPRPEGDQRPGFDRLILAADRRTLFVELQENPDHLDQVRVLIEAREYRRNGNATCERGTRTTTNWHSHSLNRRVTYMNAICW